MKQTIFLVGPTQKQYAKQCIDAAPADYVVEIRKKTRSLEQNARLWAMLTDISRQVEWYGRMLKPEDWKHVFSAALKKQEAVAGLDGGFVVLGQPTRNMTIQEMKNLMDLMSAFGDERGVKWSEPERQDDEYMRRYG